MEFKMTTQELSNSLKNAGLDEIAIDLTNIGKVGIAPDFSQNMPTTAAQDTFPFVEWLLATPASTEMRRLRDRNELKFNHDSKDKETKIVLPFMYNTTPPIDTTGQCCFITPDINMCSNQVPLRMLCIKDCDKLLNRIVDKMQGFGSTDSLTPFTQENQKVYEAKIEWMRRWMRIYTAHTIMNGMLGVETVTTKEFHGGLEVMNNDSVVVIPGANPLAGFDLHACYLAILGVTNAVYWMHPLVYEGLQRTIVADRNGNLPAGWAKTTTGELTFKGYRLRTDKLMPIDLDKGTGEIWFVDADTTGALTATTLRPQPDYVYDTTEHGMSVADGCAMNCVYMYNAGTVFNTNPFKLAIIQGVPIAANCAGGILTGLDGLIQPNTIIPGLHATDD